jgi:hypothetical protein
MHKEQRGYYRIVSFKKEGTTIMIRRLIIGLAFVAVLLISVAPAQASTQTTLFKWVHQGSGSLTKDTSGIAPGWKTVFWCTGHRQDVAVLTEYDALVSGNVPLYTVRFRCDGTRHTHLESNSLFNELWTIQERPRDTFTLEGIGQCLIYC